MNNLTQIIRYRRLEQHLKLSELGDASGMSGGIISRFENGITRQTLTTVVKLAYALHIKPAEIATSLGIEPTVIATRFAMERLASTNLAGGDKMDCLLKWQRELLEPGL